MQVPTSQCAGTATTSRCINRPAESLGESEPLLELGTDRARDREQDLVALGLFQSIDEVERVVGVEIGERTRQILGAELPRDLIAQRLVELRDDLRWEDRTQGIDQIDAAFRTDQTEELRELGIMQLARDVANRLGVAGVERLKRPLDHRGIEADLVTRSGIFRGLGWRRRDHGVRLDRRRRRRDPGLRRRTAPSC